MARQITDLPQLSKTTINKNDLALFRDVSAKSDKNITLEDLALAVSVIINGGQICPYAVGDILMTEDSQDPSERFKGTTWVAWGRGRVPVSLDTSDADFDTAGETGGEKTHTLTVNEMPAHKHTLNGYGYQGALGSNAWRFGGGGSIKSDDLVSSVGGGQSHNNLQPYITCYMWKRTA